MTMMTAHTRRVTGGVDTHADVHVAAVLDSATGQLLGTASFATTAAGYEALADWIAGHGAIDKIVVESTGSYGAGLTRHLTASASAVVEVDRPDRQARRRDGNSDPTDAIAAARAALSGRAAVIPKFRDGAVEAIRALEVVYHGAVLDRTRAINQFKSLVVSAPEEMRQQFRGRLSLNTQLTRARRLRCDQTDPVQANTRIALRELAARVVFLNEQNRRLQTGIHDLVATHSPALLGVYGVGPHAAAQLLAAAGDNPHRLRSEAAFAKLCGACPIPASSGKTIRHRLNRGGDRRANNALFHIVLAACDTTNRHASTSPAAPPKASPTARSCAASSASSPARSTTRSSTRPPTYPPAPNSNNSAPHEHSASPPSPTSSTPTPTSICRLERGHTHDTHLAYRIRDWLTTSP